MLLPRANKKSQSQHCRMIRSASASLMRQVIKSSFGSLAKTMPKTPKRPRDVSQLAKMMVDIASGEAVTKDSAAVSLGRKGGLKGGVARWANLTPEQRSEDAMLAAQARWRKKKLRSQSCLVFCNIHCEIERHLNGCLRWMSFIIGIKVCFHLAAFANNRSTLLL